MAPLTRYMELARHCPACRDYASGLRELTGTEDVPSAAIEACITAFQCGHHFEQAKAEEI